MRAPNDKTDIVSYENMAAAMGVGTQAAAAKEKPHSDIFIDISDQTETVKRGLHHSSMKNEQIAELSSMVTINVCNVCDKELTADETARVEYQGRCRLCDLKLWEE